MTGKQRMEANEPEPDQAELITRSLQRGIGKYWSTFADPNEREKFVEGLRERLGAPSRANGTEAPSEEQPFDQGKYFGDVKGMQSEYDKRHKKL